MPRGVRAAKKEEERPSAAQAFSDKLTGLGLASTLRLAEEYVDANYEVISTGYPGLDRCFGPNHLGLPRRRQSEWYAKKEHSGKTSILLLIGQYWQSLGLSVGYLEIEKTTTKDYLLTLGYLLEADPERPEIIPLYWMRPCLDKHGEEREDVTAEDILNTVSKAANLFDLLIIDSVDALVSKDDFEKESEDNDRTGGISKKMRSFMRKNVNRKAHIAWINHANQNLGGGRSGAPPSYSTSGGKSIPRYSTLRVELTVIGKLAEGDKDPYGFITRFQVNKNKMGWNWRYVDLNYLYGEGFSRLYDYFKVGLKLGIIEKKGSWFTFHPTGERVQGELKMYELIRDTPDWRDKLMKLIDGEEIHEVGVGEGDEEAALAAETE